jgi:hypothetical protein
MLQKKKKDKRNAKLKKHIAAILLSPDKDTS